MGAAYTFHLPADAVPGDPGALDRAELVRDGFSWGALISPPLWLLVHRHWLSAIVVLAAMSALVAGMWAAGIPIGTIVAVDFLVHLLIGFEGASIRRLAYGLRNRPARDVVTGSSVAEVEARAFERWLDADDRPVQRAGATAPSSFRPTHEPVIGLFPDLEGRRS